MALFNANRTISIAGACLPISPYGRLAELCLLKALPEMP